VVVFREGFHLLELIVCLLVIAVIAGLAVARFDQTSRRERASAAARQIAAEVERVQREADASSSTRHISFERRSGKYSITAGNDTELRQGSVARDPFLAEIYTTTFADDRIVFSGFGLPDEGGMIAVRSGGWEVTITVNGVTGEREVSRPVPVSCILTSSDCWSIT
jgi:Tfp pilus assembly protein PilE